MRTLATLLSLSLVLGACHSSLPAARAPVAAPTAAEAGPFVTSSNALAFDLYGKIRARGGNLALSPISISAALTMAWAGARGDTAAQMKQVLHAGGEAEHAMDVPGRFLGSLGNADHKVTLRVANRLFGEKAYTFDQGYLDRTREAFGAPLEAMDFKHDADASRVHINEWVAAQTQDRIADLLPAGALDAETRLVLTNAIYFLGDWQTPFTKDATRPAAFHVGATSAKDVPTMNQVGHFNFAATDGVKVLEMPYEGGEAVMTLVLPDAPDGLSALEQRLSPEVLTTWVSAMHSGRVVVALPKFEINPAASLSLGDTLKELGMPLAFDPKKADFTAIASPPDPADRLYLSKVVHKAFVKLDEKGTEAGAATAVDMAIPTSVEVDKPSEFKADHPFLFFLRDVKSGAILFMGRVSDPAAK
jgi:serpin B